MYVHAGDRSARGVSIALCRPTASPTVAPVRSAASESRVRTSELTSSQFSGLKRQREPPQNWRRKEFRFETIQQTANWSTYNRLFVAVSYRGFAEL